MTKLNRLEQDIHTYDVKDEFNRIIETLIEGDYVIEKGSNSKGSWEKWASGKLVQWGRKTGSAGSYTTRSSGEIYRTDLVNTDFPISFSSNDPTVEMNIVATGGTNGWQMLVGQPNSVRTGNICMQRYGSDDSETTYLLSWIAIGRWEQGGG